MDKEEKPIDYLSYYVKPHKKISKEITDKDLERVVKDAEILHKLCFTPVGIYPGGLALAHQQITKKKPLRFFVFKDGRIIINPVIIRHTNHTIDSKEGCLSFSDRFPIIVQRCNKIEVEYQTIEKDGGLSDTITENLSGIESKVYQHEIGHFDCDYIYK